LLRLIAESTRDDDPAFADLLDRLTLIHVQSVPFESRDAEYVHERVARAAARFDRIQNWERVVHVRGKKESSFVSLKTRRGRVAGLLMVVVDARSEVFCINIVGDIDLAQIGRIGRKFDIEQLEEVRIPKKR